MNSAFSRCRLMKAERPHPGLIRRILTSAALLFILWFMAAPADVHAAEASVAGAMIEDGNVVVASTGITATDDGIYHLFAQFPYESGTQGVEVAQAPAGEGAVFVFPLMKDTPHSYLCRKFTLVVWQGGKLRQVGGYRYISNPEVLSASPRRRLDYGKKGLLISSELFERLEFADLGIRQITYNVPIGNLCNGGGVPFIYNGKQHKPEITVGIPAANAFISSSLPAATPMYSANPMQLHLAVGSILWQAGILVMLLWGILSLLGGETRLGIGLLVLWAVIALVRSIIEPRIVGQQMGVHPLITLAAIFIGGKLFGFAGMLLLPIAAGVTASVLAAPQE